MRHTMAERREAKDATDLDDFAVDGTHGAHDPEVDRKEHADGDQDDLGGLEDAEPQDEQRHPGDRGDGTQALQAGIEQAVGSAE